MSLPSLVPVPLTDFSPLFSVFNLTLKKQNSAADWMTDAGVPIVFPVGGVRRKLLSCKSIQHELFLSSVVRDSFVWSKDLLVVARWRYTVDVTFGTSPDLFDTGYQQNRGHFSRSTCCKMTGFQWRLFTGISDILAHYCLGVFVRCFKHVALRRFISLCEYIIFQWGPPGNLPYPKLQKGVRSQGWKWECGQHFIHLSAFMNS